MSNPGQKRNNSGWDARTPPIVAPLLPTSRGPQNQGRASNGRVNSMGSIQSFEPRLLNQGAGAYYENEEGSERGVYEVFDPSEYYESGSTNSDVFPQVQSMDSQLSVSAAASGLASRPVSFTYSPAYFGGNAHPTTPASAANLEFAQAAAAALARYPLVPNGEGSAPMSPPTSPSEFYRRQATPPSGNTPVHDIPDRTHSLSNLRMEDSATLQRAYLPLPAYPSSPPARAMNESLQSIPSMESDARIRQPSIRSDSFPSSSSGNQTPSYYPRRNGEGLPAPLAVRVSPAEAVLKKYAPWVVTVSIVPQQGTNSVVEGFNGLSSLRFSGSVRITLTRPPPNTEAAQKLSSLPPYPPVGSQMPMPAEYVRAITHLRISLRVFAETGYHFVGDTDTTIFPTQEIHYEGKSWLVPPPSAFRQPVYIFAGDTPNPYYIDFPFEFRVPDNQALPPTLEATTPSNTLRCSHTLTVKIRMADVTLNLDHVFSSNENNLPLPYKVDQNGTTIDDSKVFVLKDFPRYDRCAMEFLRTQRGSITWKSHATAFDSVPSTLSTSSVIGDNMPVNFIAQVSPLTFGRGDELKFTFRCAPSRQEGRKGLFVRFRLIEEWCQDSASIGEMVSSGGQYNGRDSPLHRTIFSQTWTEQIQGQFWRDQPRTLRIPHKVSDINPSLLSSAGQIIAPDSQSTSEMPMSVEKSIIGRIGHFIAITIGIDSGTNFGDKFLSVFKKAGQKLTGTVKSKREEPGQAGPSRSDSQGTDAFDSAFASLDFSSLPSSSAAVGANLTRRRSVHIVTNRQDFNFSGALVGNEEVTLFCPVYVASRPFSALQALSELEVESPPTA
ncbi:hypothetical protein BJ742DRAFT_871745 [Cladochytrium replicatum]|nr:hypothetical protein BJ742DRAFT_871745 [Cladochytrium replicatum]